MRTTATISGVRRIVRQWKKAGKRVGFVPTMGALHEGHLSLIRHSRTVTDHTVVSIFVNPTQFGPGEDFKAYPRTLTRDLALCRSEGTDLVFVPATPTMYPEGEQTRIHVGSLGDPWEGRVRPGHFDGVATVVLKLFEIVSPDVAVFGQKDFQQAAILLQMVRDLNLPVKLLVRPTVREADGLALSSRNVYLDSLSRQEAPVLYKVLKWARARVRNGRVSVASLERRMRAEVEGGGGFTVDYVAFCDPNTLESKATPVLPLVILIAATCRRAGPAKGRRFIDNILIRN